MTHLQSLMYSKAAQIDQVDFINHWIDLMHSGSSWTKAYFQTESDYRDIKGRNRYTSLESFKTSVNIAYKEARMAAPRFREIGKGYIPPKLRRAVKYGILPIYVSNSVRNSY